MSDHPFRSKSNSQVFYRLLATGLCFCAGVAAALVWLRIHRPSEEGLPDYGVIQPTKQKFNYEEIISINFINEEPDPTDWIGLFFPNDPSNRTVMYQYTCGGTQRCRGNKVYGGTLNFGGENTELFSGYNLTWPLCSGDYVACLKIGKTNETLACSKTLTVLGDAECVGFNDEM